MNQTFVSLSSLAMDLKRVALGYHHGSESTAIRFYDEALKRKQEIDVASVAPYVAKLLQRIDTLLNETNKGRVADDALMLSTLFQNAALQIVQKINR